MPRLGRCAFHSQQGPHRLYLTITMPRVLLFGAGAIGLAYAYVLHKAGVELTLVCRGNFDAVSTNGISIDSAIFGQHSFRPHGVVRTCAEAPGAWDFLVVCSKVFPGIPELIAPAVSDGTTIVLIQSGASPARSCGNESCGTV